MNKKLWGGRFSSEADAFAEGFGASIHFDIKLAKYDLQGSIAHARMLGHCNIVNKEESEALVKGLQSLLLKHEKGELDYSVADEDVHLNMERHLRKEVGEVAGKLHTARSRNDQVALDFHLYVRAQIINSAEAILNLQEVLTTLAENNPAVILPGYTHVQRAQPILFSHHILAYVQMLQRDAERLKDLWKRVNICPLGAGALAGTTFPIDREYVASLLKFDGIYENSLDAVSDRDFALEYLGICANIMVHLSRLSEEVVLWSSAEFSFVELDDAFSTGSSIMPQKKNADYAELIRGKAGRVFGALMALHTTMKALPLAYNKDMQEDKEQVFDACETILGCLRVAAGMMRTIKVKENNMRAAASRGFTNATDAADYLAKKGLPFRDAHEVVGKLVKLCVEQSRELDTLPLNEFKKLSVLFEDDIYQAINLDTVVNRRNVRGGTSLEAVSKQLNLVKQSLSTTKNWVREKGSMI